jgi:hypothetical protein
MINNTLTLSKTHYKKIDLFEYVLLLFPLLINIVGFIPFVKKQSAIVWLILSFFSFLLNLSLIIVLTYKYYKKNIDKAFYFSIISLILVCLLNELAWIIVDLIAVLNLYTWKQMRGFYSVLEVTNIFTCAIYFSSYCTLICYRNHQK